MGKPLTEKMKKQISDYYHNRNMSDGLIAETLGVSRDSVRRHRDYNFQEVSTPISAEKTIPPSQNSISETAQMDYAVEETEIPNQSNQNQIADETVEPDNIDYEAEIAPDEGITPVITKVRKLESCPECGTPRSEWININQVDDATEEEKQMYDYVCLKCKELISEYICPECSTPRSEWIPINEVDEATDKEKRLYDYICPECAELIKI